LIINDIYFPKERAGVKKEMDIYPNVPTTSLPIIVSHPLENRFTNGFPQFEIESKASKGKPRIPTYSRHVL